MEDDWLISGALGYGMLSALPDGNPVLQARIKDCQFGKYFRQRIVIEDGRIDRVSDSSPVDRLRPSAGHCDGTDIYQMYLIWIRLFFDRLNDVQRRTDIGV